MNWGERVGLFRKMGEKGTGQKREKYAVFCWAKGKSQIIQWGKVVETLSVWKGKTHRRGTQKNIPPTESETVGERHLAGMQ